MDVGNHGACGLNCGYSAGLVYILCEKERLEIVDVSQVATDHDGTQNVYQAIDEAAKNHDEDDSDDTNPGRMYERPGKYIYN